jgi:biotin carboxyl carrier protein
MANEIKADRPGTVRRVVAKNGEAVGYHDVLMQIEAE